ncbi:MAG: hypothetical protein KAS38_21590, partial [Anaerolineales bacterium]|nr:hypothetical protein [Anaerolineales bacterium]
ALPLGDARLLRHDSTVKDATGQADQHLLFCYQNNLTRTVDSLPGLTYNVIHCQRSARWRGIWLPPDT